MKNTILDYPENEPSNQVSSGLLIGFGIFIYLAISSASYLFEYVIFDAMIYLKVNPQFVFWTKEIVVLIILFIGVIYGISKFKLKTLSSTEIAKKYIKAVIVILIIALALHFGYGYYKYDFLGSDYLENLSNYYDTIRSTIIISIFETVFQYLRYAVIGVPFLVK